MAECRVAFVTRALLEKIEGASLPALERVILIEDFQEIDLQRVPELLRQIKEKVETLRQRAEQFLAEHGLPRSPKTAPRPDDLAAIVYTSGTTGYSKGVMLTQGNIASDVLAALRYFDLIPTEKIKRHL